MPIAETPARRVPSSGPATRTFLSSRGGYVAIDGIVEWAVLDGNTSDVLGPAEEINVVGRHGDTVVVRRRRESDAR